MTGFAMTICRHFKKYLNIVAEFIPQLIFLVGIFGYLNILIFYKWLAFDATDASCAPSLLIGITAFHRLD